MKTAPRAWPRELTLAIAADDITLLTDALLLRQALGNLLDNAIDFSPRAATIELTVTRREDTAVIGVRDQGPGIPDYAQERLFERFYSLPRPEGAKSTGLGLPFVREAVALHRGRVTVVKRPAGACWRRLNCRFSDSSHRTHRQRTRAPYTGRIIHRERPCKEHCYSKSSSFSASR
ncbi:hypothetical protein LP420_17225 [Massilia sp. B-10]|nr:hypothetical protein LP420_17225 [Massilia sp. B-10]